MIPAVNATGPANHPVDSKRNTQLKTPPPAYPAHNKTVDFYSYVILPENPKSTICNPKSEVIILRSSLPSQSASSMATDSSVRP